MAGELQPTILFRTRRLCCALRPGCASRLVDTRSLARLPVAAGRGAQEGKEWAAGRGVLWGEGGGGGYSGLNGRGVHRFELTPPQP